MRRNAEDGEKRRRRRQDVGVLVSIQKRMILDDAVGVTGGEIEKRNNKPRAFS
jgi:hypothetical protein